MAKQTKQSLYEEKAEQLLAPIAEKHGVRIYDVEYVREGADYYLRCYIDKDGGVTIDDCVDVSHDLSDELDRTDPIPDAYILEVSSPGLGRSLTRDRHLANSIGQSVELSFYKKSETTGTKGLNGTLKAFDDTTVTILAADAGIPSEMNGTELVISRKEISVIRLAVEF